MSSPPRVFPLMDSLLFQIHTIKQQHAAHKRIALEDKPSPATTPLKSFTLPGNREDAMDTLTTEDVDAAIEAASLYTDTHKPHKHPVKRTLFTRAEIEQPATKPLSPIKTLTDRQIAEIDLIHWRSTFPLDPSDALRISPAIKKQPRTPHSRRVDELSHAAAKLISMKGITI